MCAMMKAIGHVKNMCVASVIEAAEGRGALVASMDLVKISNSLSWFFGLIERVGIGLEQVVTRKHVEARRR